MKFFASQVVFRTFFLFAAAFFCGMGCKSSQYAERFGLGTMDQQKAKAAEFDPFPLNDIGPPVMGARPRGFFDPLPEAKRAEQQARQQSPYSGYTR